MFRTASYALLGLVLAVGAACGSSTSAVTGTPTPAVATLSPTPQASGLVAYDPCVLMTASEASALAGVTYGPGKETLAHQVECIYGSQTADMLTIGIVQDADQAAAQADRTQAEAALQSAAASGAQVTQVQGVGDAATEIQTSYSSNGTTFVGCGIYVMKGAIFFDITDLAVGHACPGNAALQSQALTVLSRL
jgi:hypothetical protein